MQVTATDTPEENATGTGWSGFRRGVRDIMPVMIGVVPFGLTYAVLAAEKGLSFNQIMLKSALMFAGASQFVALELWSFPPPFWPILLAVLAVNFRHVLYSATMGRKMRHWPAAGRLFGFFFLVDPNYAFVELKAGKKLSAGYYFGLSLPMYSGWLVITAIGAIFGEQIGDTRVYALDFVFAAYFTYIILGFRNRPNAYPVVIASAVGGLAAYFLIGPPWHIAIGASAGIVTAAALARGPTADSEAAT